MSGTIALGSNKLFNIGNVTIKDASDNLHTFQLGDYIDAALNADDNIATKQLKSPNPIVNGATSSNYIKGDFTAGDFSAVPEGSTNLYFTPERILDEKTISIVKLADSVTDIDINYGSGSTDTIEDALNKINTRLERGTYSVDSDSVESFSIDDNSVDIDKLTTSGATTGDVLFYDGEMWSPRKLNGINIKGEWDIHSTPDPKDIEDPEDRILKPGNILLVTNSNTDETVSRIFNDVNYREGDLLYIREVNDSTSEITPIKFHNRLKLQSSMGGQLYHLKIMIMIGPKLTRQIVT